VEFGGLPDLQTTTVTGQVLVDLAFFQQVTHQGKTHTIQHALASIQISQQQAPTSTEDYRAFA
jgi:hypothetical protein